MSYTYFGAVTTGFPNVRCSTSSDDSYDSLVWEGGDPIPSKEVLDAWIQSHSNLVIPINRITVLAFRNRFTQAEKIAIDLSSIDDPAGTVQQRQLAASVRVLNADLAVAKFVDLDRPDTVGGVQALEAYGVIGTGRAAQILSTIIQDHERPLSV